MSWQYFIECLRVTANKWASLSQAVLKDGDSFALSKHLPHLNSRILDFPHSFFSLTVGPLIVIMNHAIRVIGFAMDKYNRSSIKKIIIVINVPLKYIHISHINTLIYVFWIENIVLNNIHIWEKCSNLIRIFLVPSVFFFTSSNLHYVIYLLSYIDIWKIKTQSNDNIILALYSRKENLKFVINPW